MSVRRVLTGKVLASIAALSAFGAFGAAGTYSAFTSTTSASGSQFASGTVSLVDDDAGTALFNLTGLVPGLLSTKCINVTNAGDVPFTSVELTGSGTGVLSSVLDITVDRGSGATGGSAGSCTGFVQGTANLLNTTLSALGATAPVVETTGWSAGATKSYRISVRLNLNASNLFQGKTGDLGLTWTAST